MPAHIALHNKADFDKALETKGKYVFIYIHDGTIPPQAEEGASKFSASSVAYSVDASEEPKVKDYFKISTVPAAVIYKDGSEVKKIENMSPDNMAEVASILSS